MRRPSPVRLVIGKTRGGVRRYADDLRDGLLALGTHAEVASRPGPRGTLNHFHLANSTREVLRWLALGGGPSVLTVHDVLPRQPVLRALLARPQTRLVGRHHVIVHARGTEELLRRLGFRGDATVIPMGAPEPELDSDEVARLREELSPDGRPIVTMAGVSKVAKGSLELMEAARAIPELRFVFVGSLSDAKTQESMASAPPNVTHAGEPDDDGFLLHLAASDILLCFRREWLGEVSLTVTQAHAVGTPVAGFRSGFLPEYSGTRDRLYDPGLSIGDALRTLVEAGFPGRVPPEESCVTTWSEVARAHIEVYERVLEEGSTGRQRNPTRGGDASA